MHLPTYLPTTRLDLWVYEFRQLFSDCSYFDPLLYRILTNSN